MTLIRGARCKDGVILVGDRKIIEGTTSFADNKITIMPFGVALSGAGMGDFFDKFGIKLNNYISDRTIELNKAKEIGKVATSENLYSYIDDFITDCETILIKLKEDYKDIQPQLHILMGLRNNNKAELHFLDLDYGVDSIRKSFMTIGSGSPYANFFLRGLWTEDLTMKQMAKISVFIINYISEHNLDDAVGYGYQIVEIPDLFPEMPEGEGGIKEVRINLADVGNIGDITEKFYEKVKDLKKELI